ncbi:MAG: HEAT repeat domain-containing protein, partial [Gemmatimonadales bacterium]|nr:HEAT repeat domain-containing protein [Gemmatimonadales bacterium]
AITGLSEIRDRSALEALVGALRSDDPVIRRQAAMALGQRESE